MTWSAGVMLIDDERSRQIDVEGFVAVADDRLAVHNELALAAACYALPADRRNNYVDGAPHWWPWAVEWWKPVPDNRVRELTKAGALIAAEIDRLLRAEEIHKGVAINDRG